MEAQACFRNTPRSLSQSSLSSSRALLTSSWLPSATNCFTGSMVTGWPCCFSFWSPLRRAAFTGWSSDIDGLIFRMEAFLGGWELKDFTLLPFGKVVQKDDMPAGELH